MLALAELDVVVMCKVGRRGEVLWWLTRASGAATVECGCRERGEKCKVLDRRKTDKGEGYIALRVSRVCSKGMGTDWTYVGVLSTECLDFVVGTFISDVVLEWQNCMCSLACGCIGSFTEREKPFYSGVWEENLYVGNYFCCKKKSKRIA